MFSNFSKSLLLVMASALMPAVCASEVAAYWGQNQGRTQERLSTYCESSSLDIVIVSFVNGFPDLEVNFSNQCGLTFDSGLLHCTQIGEDIKYCQSLGKKILLSLGGFDSTGSFSSDTEGTEFAKTLWNKFGGGSDSERPFDDAIVDGFDFDIENGSNTGYAALAIALRSYFDEDVSKNYYLSAAPQCPYPDTYVGEMLTSAYIDYAFIQFYNNYCNLGDNFNWADWAEFAASVSPNKNIKLFLGLPGSAASGGGYTPAATVEEYFSEIQCSPNFGGFSVWDALSAWTNIDSNGDNYIDQLKNILDKADSCSTSTSSSATFSDVTSSDVTLSVTSSDVTLSVSSSDVTLSVSSSDVTLSVSSSDVTLPVSSSDVTLPVSSSDVTLPVSSSDVTLPVTSFVSSSISSFVSSSVSSSDVTSSVTSSVSSSDVTSSDVTLFVTSYFTTIITSNVLTSSGFYGNVSSSVTSSEATSKSSSSAVIAVPTVLAGEFTDTPKFTILVPGELSPFDVHASTSQTFTWSDVLDVTIDGENTAVVSLVSLWYYRFFQVTASYAESLTGTAVLEGVSTGTGEYVATFLIVANATPIAGLGKRDGETFTITATATVVDAASTAEVISDVKSGATSGASDLVSSTGFVTSTNEKPVSSPTGSADITGASTVIYPITICSDNKCSAVETSGVVTKVATTDKEGKTVTIETTVPCDTTTTPAKTVVYTVTSCSDNKCSAVETSGVVTKVATTDKEGKTVTIETTVPCETTEGATDIKTSVAPVTKGGEEVSNVTGDVTTTVTGDVTTTVTGDVTTTVTGDITTTVTGDITTTVTINKTSRSSGVSTAAYTSRAPATVASVSTFEGAGVKVASSFVGAFGALIALLM